MDPQYYMLHRDEVEKDGYERQKVYEKLEARWPKWIKRSANIAWVIIALVGFFTYGAMGAMIGFTVGGALTMLYEKICRRIVGKKLGIEDISYKEAVKDVVAKQNERFREREAAMIAAENEKVLAEMEQETPSDITES